MSTSVWDDGDTCGDATPADSMVKVVYELREAAVEHGKALAALEAAPSPATRDALLETQIDLERKTVLAVDECGEND
jgi:hypothetical protein